MLIAHDTQHTQPNLCLHLEHRCSDPEQLFSDQHRRHKAYSPAEVSIVWAICRDLSPDCIDYWLTGSSGAHLGVTDLCRVEVGWAILAALLSHGVWALRHDAFPSRELVISRNGTRGRGKEVRGSKDETACGARLLNEIKRGELTIPTSSKK